MPIIDTGTIRFMLEEDQSYAGWTLECIDHISPGAQLGTHGFVFSRPGIRVQVSNKYWIADRMPCSINWNEGRCPIELRIFGCKDTKVTEYSAAKWHEQGTDLY